MIRFGDASKVQSYLEDNDKEVLNIPFMHDIKLDILPDLEGTDNEDQMCDNEMPMITLRPLQVAIVAGQKGVIEVILKFIAQIEDADDCQAALENILGHQASVIFTSDLCTYDKDDRSLDGMNCFHLAARYYPEGIKIIFDILKSENVLYSNVLDLLLKQDKHLQQTPLHVAIRRVGSKCTEAARYDL